jgi:hypothetical protein
MQLKRRLSRLAIISLLGVGVTIGAFSIFAFADAPVQVVENAHIDNTSLENSDSRVLLICGVGGCTTTAQLFTPLHFKCPGGGSDKCTVSITMSAAHNCAPQNQISGDLSIDGTTVPATPFPLVMCNPNDANGNIDNLTSYTWVRTGLTGGDHTANVVLTYKAVDGTGIGFDHQSLIVNTYQA